MAIGDDWTIDYTAKTITHTAGTDVYALLEIYQWLASVFSEMEQMDDAFVFTDISSAVLGFTLKFISSWGFGAEATDTLFIKSGSIYSFDDNYYWKNVTTDESVWAGKDLNIVQDGVPLVPWWSTGNIDITVKTKDAGVWIDNGNLYINPNGEATTLIYPPIHKKASVIHAKLARHRIMVAEATAPNVTTVKKNQYTISTAGMNFIQLTTLIEINKTPLSGILRIDDKQYTYTSFVDDTFTVEGDATGETGDLYVPILDKLATTSTEDSSDIINGDSFNVVIIIRKYGYKEYVAPAVFGENNLMVVPTLAKDTLQT